MSNTSTTDAGAGADADAETESADQPTDNAGSDTRTGDDPAAEVERLRAELAKARKWEDRAKANANAANELEQLRQQTMSDAERAVEQAKAEARAATIAEFGGRLVESEFRVAAAGRLDDEALAALLDDLNVANYLTDDGEVDKARVAALVDRIAPKTDEGTARFPDLGQGARGSSMPLNGDPIEASLKAKLGIR